MELTSERKRLYLLSYSALGIVFGDIGTSPLYAFSQIMRHLPVNIETVYGALSLIFWSLAVIICLKYLLIVFKADNDGEGGVIALAGILKQKITHPVLWLLFVTIFGIGLIIGDGILTPAISILSAVEGLKCLSVHFESLILPLTLFILLVLFALQKIGTGKIGFIFAPVLLVWFITIGILGAIQIFQNPAILRAINPYYLFYFCSSQKTVTFITLGAVFLVVTGGEALYANLGHFGKKPIVLAWYGIVMPGLLLCYFGQGALLLNNPKMVAYPFYGLAPQWFLPVLIILATFATIIASQAIISAVFSILKQTSLLNLIPRLKIIYTSASEMGQVYLPFINAVLLVGTCTLVIVFRSSQNLAGAFGIAVNLDMLITSILVSIIAASIWKWNWFKLCFFQLILVIEVAFLIGNLPKITDGGWVPIGIASIVLLLMYSWHCGFEKLREKEHRDGLFGHFILDELNQNKISRQAGTILFIIDPYDHQGESLLHHLRVNRVIYETMIFLSIKVENTPCLHSEQRFEVIEKAKGLYLLIIHYGYTERVDLPKIMEPLFYNKTLPFHLEPKKIVYFIETISVEVTREKTKKIWFWQKVLFAFLLRNAVFNIQFYRIPSHKTIAIGGYYHI